jgi:hypothetical protein
VKRLHILLKADLCSHENLKSYNDGSYMALICVNCDEIVLDADIFDEMVSDRFIQDDKKE